MRHHKTPIKSNYYIHRTAVEHIYMHIIHESLTYIFVMMCVLYMCANCMNVQVYMYEN